MSTISKAEQGSAVVAMLDEVKKFIVDPNNQPYSRGARGVLGQLYSKGKVFFGFEPGEEFETQEKAADKMLSVLAPIVDVLLGETQSANSISDRDVLLQVIKPFFGSFIQEDKNGKFIVNLKSESTVLESLDRAIGAVLNSQRKALVSADAMYGTLMAVPNVKGFNTAGKDMPGVKAQGQRLKAFDTSSGMPEFTVTYSDEGDPYQMTLDTK